MAAEGMGDRFLVSLQEVKPAPDTVGYTRADTGRTTMWSTTPDQIERGDSDPELQSDIQGMRGYDPSKQYALYILDQGSRVRYGRHVRHLADLREHEEGGSGRVRRRLR